MRSGENTTGDKIMGRLYAGIYTTVNKRGKAKDKLQRECRQAETDRNRQAEKDRLKQTDRHRNRQTETERRSHSSFMLFLDAMSHLYKRACPSVSPSIGDALSASGSWR